MPYGRPPLRLSAHLRLDPEPHSPRYHGHLAPGLAIFALPTVTGEEDGAGKGGETMTAGRLAAAFFDAAGAILEEAFLDASPAVVAEGIEEGWITERSLETWRARLIDAAREAFGRFPEATARGAGGLEFSVLAARTGERWMAFNLGSNVVLRISEGRVSAVVEPDAPPPDSDLDPGSASPEPLYTTPCTALLDLELRYADELRADEVGLYPGDWLVVAPGSGPAPDLHLAQQPGSLVDLEREVIERLAGSSGAHPRSWLAIQALPR